MDAPLRVAIAGTVGVPARYGGFETLAENLALYQNRQKRLRELIVYCSSRAYPDEPPSFGSTKLRYSRLPANGAASIGYDALCLRDAVRADVDVILLLGVSGAIALPFLRRSRSKVIVNIDGIEWRRAKWKGASRSFLRWSERLAICYADKIIADNQAVADYIQAHYGSAAALIGYGGDPAGQAHLSRGAGLNSLPAEFSLSLCRIEPENNVQMILRAAAQAGGAHVFVGNWQASAYGRALWSSFHAHPSLHLLDPIYDQNDLAALRSRATLYIHGHSAGGTNPSLVEMMHYGIPILAFDCAFNRYTTEDKAGFFVSERELAAQLATVQPPEAGAAMREVASRRYRWELICAQYFDLFEQVARS